MLDGETKQHKVHGFITHEIMVLELGIDGHLQLRVVDDFIVVALNTTQGCGAVREHHTSHLIKGINFTVLVTLCINFIKVLEHSVEIEPHLFTHDIPERSQHQHPIVIVDETISEHSPNFMSPETSYHIGFIDFILVG